MDPATKDLVSKTIKHLTRNQSCVILTSHSVADCENVCNRVGILAKAGLRCIGTPQHLKHKWVSFRSNRFSRTSCVSNQRAGFKNSIFNTLLTKRRTKRWIIPSEYAGLPPLYVPDRINFEQRILTMLFQLMDRSCWFHPPRTASRQNSTIYLPSPSRPFDWFLISSHHFPRNDPIPTVGNFIKFHFQFEREEGDYVPDIPPYCQSCAIEAPLPSLSFLSTRPSPATSFSGNINLNRREYLATRPLPGLQLVRSIERNLPRLSPRSYAQLSGCWTISIERVSRFNFSFSPITNISHRVNSHSDLSIVTRSFRRIFFHPRPRPRGKFNVRLINAITRGRERERETVRCTAYRTKHNIGSVCHFRQILWSILSFSVM